MASDEFGEKTEQPTDHRRSEARRKGNVARSQDLSAAGHMLAVALALAFLGEGFISSMGRMLTVSLKNAGTLSSDPSSALRRMRDVTEFSLTSLVPLFLLMMGAAFFVNVLQVGFLVSPESLQPKLSRLNPIEGAKRILSIRSVVKLFVSLGKLVIVVAIATWFITSGVSGFLSLMGQQPASILTAIQESVVKLAFLLALALIALAILDFGFQKWKHEQDLKMTKQELRDEMKQMEGDPAIRQRRKEAHRKLAQARELQQVQHADVVIKNPAHIAVALKYDPEVTPAPVVVAKGKGAIAERIHSIALEYGVPIIERKPLAQALYRGVRVGEQIPLEMYEVFVEIMAYVYRISGRTPPNLT